MTVKLDMPTPAGASREAIDHHYSFGNDFFRLWLDESLTYSGALWNEPENPQDNPQDTLEEAQARKLDYHIAQAGAAGADRVLDVGCGWGSGLKRMTEVHGVKHATGLTLSEAQAEWIASQRWKNVEMRMESWADHTPVEPYDAIISIGAFEHFAKATLTPAGKIDAYREYFARCHQLLKPGRRMTLQTIAYGNISKENLSRFIEVDIFPESNLPSLTDIASASSGFFEIVCLRNDRQHYERTTKTWLERLKANRRVAAALVGEQGVVRYERYLSLFTIGFHIGSMHLLRITLRRNDVPQHW